MRSQGEANLDFPAITDLHHPKKWVQKLIATLSRYPLYAEVTINQGYIQTHA